jgi:serine/threonine protein kinase
MVVGTPHYIAPEQAKGVQQVDIRADIYSLGGTLFHAVTGRTPFAGTSAAAIMTKHVTDLVDDPRKIRPGISEGMVLLIAKMMAKRPEDRYVDPEALMKDIRIVAKKKVPEHLRSQKRPGIKLPGLASTATATASAPVAGVSRAKDEGRRQRGGSRRAQEPDVMSYIVKAIVVLVVMGIIIWLIT